MKVSSLLLSMALAGGLQARGPKTHLKVGDKAPVHAAFDYRKADLSPLRGNLR
jgi:hypothetical protein